MTNQLHTLKHYLEQDWIVGKNEKHSFDAENPTS